MTPQLSAAVTPPYPPPSSSSAAVAGAQPQGKDQSIASAEQLVLDLCDPQLRKNALLDLSKEIVSIYSFLTPPTLTPGASNRVCNALALLQVDDAEVIGFLLQTEIIPLCLRAMETSSELLKTVSDQSYSPFVC